MNVLVLSKYGLRAASPRYRFIQYERYLAGKNIYLHFSPLLGDDYLASRLTDESVRLLAVGRAIARRIESLIGARRWDVVWVHCELFPYFPPWIEQWLSRRGVRIVYDYDDAIHHMYDDHSNRVVRFLLSGKIQKVISSSAVVTAGSPYLVKYAEQFCSSVFFVPTTVDTDRLPIKRHIGSERLRICWIGSPSSTDYLLRLEKPLQRLANQLDFELVAIGARPFSFQGVRVRQREWSERTEVDDLVSCDVGIMPLVDEPFARGKCAFKLIQYMACGLPVVASPIGMNQVLVNPRVGFLAKEDSDWVNALSELASDPQARQEMGDSARRLVEKDYSVHAVAPAVERALRCAAGR